jgi:hypothetical protein
MSENGRVAAGERHGMCESALMVFVYVRVVVGRYVGGLASGLRHRITSLQLQRWELISCD